MSGMHLLPIYYTTTNTRKRKKKLKTKSQIVADTQHAKFLKKMGIDKKSVPQSGSASALSVEDRFDSYHSDHSIPVGIAPKKKLIPHNFTIAPAYNKGAYQVISKKAIKDIGR